MIILQIVDPHLDTATPRSRKDDYFESVKAKLLEVRDLANSENGGEPIVGCFVGDLIHRQQGHLVPYRLTNWLIDYFQGWKRRPFLILGNHDILSRPEHWERQPIGAIIKSGVVNVLDFQKGMTGRVRDEGNNLDVVFTGTPYYYGLDQDRVGYNIPRQDGDFHVHLIHGALFPEGMSYFGDFTVPSQITGFGGDLMLCGHMHEDLGVFEGKAVGGHSFKIVNFGALARGSVSGFNLNRVVQLGWIRVYREDGAVRCSIQPKPLACAQPAEKIFYVEELRRKKTQQADMAKLAEAFSSQSTTGFELVAPKILLESYLTQKRVSPEAEKLVRFYVDRAEQELA